MMDKQELAFQATAFAGDTEGASAMPKSDNKFNYMNSMNN
jgi:hypothetical protein